MEIRKTIFVKQCDIVGCGNIAEYVVTKNPEDAREFRESTFVHCSKIIVGLSFLPFKIAFKITSIAESVD